MENIAEIIYFLAGVLIWIIFMVFMIFSVWHGLKVSIGDKFSFGMYPMKRFFEKDSS